MLTDGLENFGMEGVQGRVSGKLVSGGWYLVPGNLVSGCWYLVGGFWFQINYFRLNKIPL